jgi:hypothetical protein
MKVYTGLDVLIKDQTLQKKFKEPVSSTNIYDNSHLLIKKYNWFSTT